MLVTRPRSAGWAVPAAAGIAAALLLSGPAMADKLVIFKNGKALLVEAVEQEGQWYRFDFGSEGSLSVPASSIEEVTDAELNPGSRREGAPNQMVQGEVRNYSNRGNSNRRNSNARQRMRALNRGNDGDNTNREEPQVQPGAARRGPNRSTARTVRSNPRNNPILQGLTPLNTNQAQSGRGGLLNRRGRFTNRDAAAQTEENREEQADDDDN